VVGFPPWRDGEADTSSVGPLPEWIGGFLGCVFMREGGRATIGVEQKFSFQLCSQLSRNQWMLLVQLIYSYNQFLCSYHHLSTNGIPPSPPYLNPKSSESLCLVLRGADAWGLGLVISSRWKFDPYQLAWYQILAVDCLQTQFPYTSCLRFVKQISGRLSDLVFVPMLG